MVSHNFDFGNTLSKAMRGEHSEADLAAKSFSSFAPYVIKSEDDGKRIHLQNFQLKVIEALESPAPLVLIILPRGFSKSQLVTSGYSSYRIGQDRNVRIIVVSDTKEQAIRHLRGVETILNDPDYHEVFGDYVPRNVKGIKWTEDTKHVLRTREMRDPTLYGVGVGGAITGHRGNIIICDDIISPEAAISAAERDKAWHWYNNALLPILVPGGKVVVINTRYHADDIAGHLLEDYKDASEDEFRVIDIPALIRNEDGEEESIWEERFPTQFLKNLRERNYFSFQANYMNDPIDLSKSQFSEAWLNYVDERELLLESGQWEFFFGIDPNTAREDIKKDFFSIAVVGANVVTHQVALVDMLHTRSNISELIQMFKAMVQKWHPIKIMLESNAAQVLYKTLFNQESEYLNYPFELVYATLKKEERIVAMAMNFMNGKVVTRAFLDEDGRKHCYPNLEPFRKEWITFPHSDTHFDALDSVDLALRPLLSYVREASISIINDIEFERRMLEEQTVRLEKINVERAREFFDEQQKFTQDFYKGKESDVELHQLTDEELDAIEDAYLDNFRPIRKFGGRL